MPVSNRIGQLIVLTSMLGGCSEESVLMPAPPDPGALVSVTVGSEVGVLLDEIPSSARTRAADALDVESDEFWIERAKRQMALLKFRLIFREYYYLDDDFVPLDEDENGVSDRLQLPLPPESTWTITLDGPPQRKDVNGHDLVVRPYTMQAMIVTDSASPGISEPNLAEIGGIWDEAFVLPVDPELTFQRTGYACTDEYEFPPNSVDSESAYVFYDDTCGVEDESTYFCHTALTQADESCVDAIDNHIGRVEPLLRFERLPYDSFLAEEYRVGELTSPGTPDLTPLAESLDENKVVYRFIPESSCAIAEACVARSGWRRLLQFTAGVHNVGGAPLEIGAVDYFVSGEEGDYTAHNLYEYSPCHDHYHFTHYGDFEIEGGNVVEGGKRAFCLVSTSRLSNNEVSPLFSPYSDCINQGVQAGWGDEYYAGLECQWIDITDLDIAATSGVADLRFDFNPDGFLCEGEVIRDEAGLVSWEPALDENGDQFMTASGEPVERPICNTENYPDWQSNNLTEAQIAVPENGSFVTEPCTRGQIGHLRNCGLSTLDADPGSCIPGQSVKLSCAAKEVGVPQMVRICEASLAIGQIPCTENEALANVVVEDTPQDITFDCPMPRDTNELGGLYGTYAAPVLPADGDPKVTCTVVPSP